jgi:hypothetical protein
MRRPGHVEPHQHHDRPPPVLHFDLRQVNPASAQVQQERLAFIRGLLR